jgi:very-short-patch-repair endonuclease
MPSRRDADALLRRFARSMRKQPTEAEQKLWHHLRDRRLGGHKFRRQTPVEGFIVDFYCEALSLVIEIDGEQHATSDGLEYDRLRTEKLKELRIRVLRFSNYEVLRDPPSVARTILRIITEGS